MNFAAQYAATFYGNQWLANRVRILSARHALQNGWKRIPVNVRCNVTLTPKGRALRSL